jgi:hypothetical protein
MSIAGIENEIESKETVFDKSMVSFFYVHRRVWKYLLDKPIPL